MVAKLIEQVTFSVSLFNLNQLALTVSEGDNPQLSVPLLLEGKHGYRLPSK